jgi:hypothetical protein
MLTRRRAFAKGPDMSQCRGDQERVVVAETHGVDNQIIWMTADDEAAYFEQQVQARLGMTGTEFLRDLDAGRWDDVIDDPDYRDVLDLALLADVVR